MVLGTDTDEELDGFFGKAWSAISPIGRASTSAALSAGKEAGISAIGEKLRGKSKRGKGGLGSIPTPILIGGGVALALIVWSLMKRKG